MERATTLLPRRPDDRAAGGDHTWPGRPAFLATFLTAWFALDRPVTSPPLASSALLALGASGGVLVAVERLTVGGSLRDIARRLGLRRPDPRGLVAAGLAGAVVVSTYLAGAALLGTDLEVRDDWPTVLVGVVVFHGLAEELVWRGYAFGHLRRRHPFWRAVGWSVPLLALTHAPIVVGNGVVVGVLAVAAAAATCVPLAYLWERSGHAVWAPAILHAAIGTWQLFERSYGSGFRLVILAASIVAPCSALLFRDRFFGGRRS